MKNNMYRCDEVAEMLSLHLDDELDEVGNGWMKRHLANCRDCARLFREMRAVDNLFQQAPAQMAPGGFAEKAVRVAITEQRRRNLRYGLLILALGTLIISSLFIVSHIELFWLVIPVLISPNFLSGAWMDEFWRAAGMMGQSGYILLRILSDLVTGPLLVPSLIALLSSICSLMFVRRQQLDRANPS